jgi:hypothetical protein
MSMAAFIKKYDKYDFRFKYPPAVQFRNAVLILKIFIMNLQINKFCRRFALWIKKLVAKKPKDNDDNDNNNNFNNPFVIL